MATTTLLTTRNQPLTNTADWRVEVAKGNIQGHVNKSVFGLNEIVGTSIEDIWTPGGTRVWLTSPVALEAISTSTDDDAGGSGANAILVEGLNSNFEAILEVITMNGTDASTATQQTFIRVNNLTTIASGTYAGSNIGTITVRTSGAGATQAEIANGVSGAGASQQSHFTIPTGFSGVLYNLFVNVESLKPARISLAFNPGADLVSGPPFAAPLSQFELVGVAGDTVITLESPGLIPARTDVWMKASVVSTSAAVSAGFSLTLLDNQYLCDQGVNFS